MVTGLSRIICAEAGPEKAGIAGMKSGEELG
jgi:hypothetical protein